MIVWKFKNLDLGLASARYRGLKPVTLLTDAGIECVALDGRAVPDWGRTERLVIVKSFTFHDLMLVQIAHRRGIPVVIDLCDNIFVDDYVLSADLEPRRIFTAMVPYAGAVTVPTEALAECVRARIGGTAPVRVIPDGVERAGDLQRYRALLELPVNAAREPFRWRQLLRKRDRRKLRKRLTHALRARLGVTPSATDEPRRRDRPESRRRVLWFGNHGATHANFGMGDLAQVRPALEALAKRHDLELLVVSNSARKYRDLVEPFRLRTRYQEWDVDRMHEWLASADVVIVPNSGEDFSQVKSANRAVMALAAGVPVVATRTEAHEPLADCMLFDDWERGIETYLEDGGTRAAHLERARAVLEERFGDDTILAAWRDVLARVEQRTECRRVAFLLTIVQDLDILLPLIAWARQQWETDVLVDTVVAARFPHVWDAARAQVGDERTHLVALGALDEARECLSGVDAFLTASETSLRPHRLAHKLTEHANRLGARTFTFQHGFENVGLTYSDDEHPIETVSFASRHILTWGGPATWHPRMKDEVRARCVPVGCPKVFDAEAITLPGIERYRRAIGVFENLHWSRYPAEFRHLFLEALKAGAAACPSVAFVVRPHQAGQWLTRRYKGGIPDSPNILILDPDSSEWRHVTARHLLHAVDAVITTPSTVAADAALCGRPVAVVAGTLSLPAYEPLPLLGSIDDWVAFCRRIEQDEAGPDDERRRFLGTHFMAGDVTQRLEPLLGRPPGTDAPVPVPEAAPARATEQSQIEVKA